MPENEEKLEKIVMTRLLRLNAAAHGIAAGLVVSRSFETSRITVCALAGMAIAALITSAVDANSSFLSMGFSSVMLVVLDCDLCGCERGACAHPLLALLGGGAAKLRLPPPSRGR